MKYSVAVLFVLLSFSALADQPSMTSDEVRQLMIEDSIRSYSGKCPCPYNTMSNGRACGGRSAYSKPGGASPLCYKQDITDEEVARYRTRRGIPAASDKKTSSNDQTPASPGSFSKGELIGQASVIDGDTIEIRGKRIRLEGIDAFESGQTCALNGGMWRCGQEAAKFMDSLIGDQNVTCDITGKDKYQRQLGFCSVEGEDINQQMIVTGYAFAYRKYSTKYVPDEEAARAAKAGAWRDGVEFQLPWEWRNGQ